MFKEHVSAPPVGENKNTEKAVKNSSSGTKKSPKPSSLATKVKLAKHTITGQEVAIKIIDKTALNPSSLQKCLSLDWSHAWLKPLLIELTNVGWNISNGNFLRRSLGELVMIDDMGKC
uniref:DUF4283 domain-containing protein n=1 Tax=Heterorhabditis bacteriophora TaxID=37862 RepID=A0A1I7WQH0_HETBA